MVTSNIQSAHARKKQKEKERKREKHVRQNFSVLLDSFIAFIMKRNFGAFILVINK